jgi:hypothetical protein
MKLSKKLIEILQLMNNDWELGFDKFRYKWWLQKGGCGYGGDSKNIHGKTNIKFLIQENLISSKGFNYPTETYCITEKGKEILK